MSLAYSLQERSFGRYNLIASLDRGGMANVYLAVAAGLASFNKLLVLKALRPDASPESVQMFLDEARLSACFNHPNIVQTYEVGEAGGRFFIALEYLEGQSLRAVQRKLGAAFPWQDELRALVAIARGLHYAHELKDFEGKSLLVVHRDISPQNVFLTYDGQVKLLDFGIAKSTISEHHTQVGLVKGKVDYIAPEQARGEPVDRRADIFSLGAMAWEAATRQRFSGGHSVGDVAKLHKRLTGGEPDVRELCPELPEPLVDAIRCALALEPAQRFATAAAFADAVESFLESSQLRPSAKTLSDALEGPYLDVRTKRTAVIEEQLKRISRDGSRDASLLVLDPADATSSLPRSLGFSSTSIRSRATEPRVSLAPSLPRSPRSLARGHKAKLGAVVGAVALATLSALSGPPQALSATKGATPTPAAARSAMSDRPTQPAMAQPPHAQTPTIEVAIRVSPGNAQVKLDGATLSDLPFQARLHRDGLVHRVEASAPGYVGATMAIAFDHDRELSVVLEPEVAPMTVDSVPTRAAVEVERASADNRVVRAAASPIVRVTPSKPGAPLAVKRHLVVHLDTKDPYRD